MTKYSIIINSCDAYEDVWNPLFHALNGSWTGKMPKIILNCESKSYIFPGLQIDKSGGEPPKVQAVDDWGGRLLRALDSVEEEYILMFFDDMLPNDLIDVSAIEECVEVLKKDASICVFYLVNPSLETFSLGSDERFVEVKSKADYILNSAPGVWRKSDLKNFVKRGDNPWAWEYFGSTRFHASGKRAFVVSSNENKVFPYKHELGGAIYRGRWVESVIVPIVTKYKLNLDLSLRGTIKPEPISHGFVWKIKFLYAGCKMVGMAALWIMLRSLVKKISVKIKEVVRG